MSKIQEKIRKKALENEEKLKVMYRYCSVCKYSIRPTVKGRCPGCGAAFPVTKLWQ